MIEIILVALLAGFSLGLVGFGWGSISLPLLILLGYDPISTIGSILVTNVLLSFVGSLNHRKNSNFKIILPLILSGLLASLAGAFFTLNISVKILTLLLSSYLILGSLSLIFYKNSTNYNLKFNKLLAAGAIPGFFEGAYGSGGPAGVITLLLFKVPVHRAVGSWLPATIALQLVPALIYIVNLKVNWDMVLTLLLGGFPAVIIGSFLSSKFTERKLKKIIALTVFILGLRLIFR